MDELFVVDCPKCKSEVEVDEIKSWRWRCPECGFLGDLDVSRIRLKNENPATKTIQSFLMKVLAVLDPDNPSNEVSSKARLRWPVRFSDIEDLILSWDDIKSEIKSVGILIRRINQAARGSERAKDLARELTDVIESLYYDLFPDEVDLGGRPVRIKSRQDLASFVLGWKSIESLVDDVDLAIKTVAAKSPKI